MWAFAQAVTVTSGIISYPIDTVRRRMMMTSGRTDRGTKVTTAMIFSGIYHNEGPKAFFKGCLSNLIRGSCGALVLVLYDKI
jgi:solute carrier family 25 (adenine nucleotide translocator) protein 4/5/6/31